MAYVYTNHYDFQERALKLKDADGKDPSFYLLLSADRGPGKTFSVCRYFLERFEETGEQFILFRRYQRELGAAAQGTFKGVFNELHPDWYMKETIKQKGTYSVITLYKGKDDPAPKECGYCIPLSMCSSVKSVSSEFVKCKWGLFDEMQPKRKQDYLPDEFSLFYDVYKSVARGEGKAVRQFKVVFTSNTIDIDDPYMYAFGLSSKIQEDTMLYRGKRVIYERVEVSGLKEMHANSDIDIAAQTYLKKRGSNLWLNTDGSLVCKPDKWGHGRYLATLQYGVDDVGLLYYPQVGLWYITRKVDKYCKHKYNLTLATGATNTPILKSVTLFKQLHKALYAGQVRVHDSALQTMLLEVLH